MKRSEMLRILEKSLYKHQQDMECCSNDFEILEHVLTDLEQAGMLPPAYDNLNSGFNQIIPTNKWEDENA